MTYARFFEVTTDKFLVWCRTRAKSDCCELKNVSRSTASARLCKIKIITESDYMAREISRQSFPTSTSTRPCD